MALSNAERQALYKQRLKDAAQAGTIAFVEIADLSFSDRTKTFVPTKFTVVPAVGDTVIVAQGDGEWTAKVLSRTIRDNEESGPRVILHCEGQFKAS